MNYRDVDAASRSMWNLLFRNGSNAISVERWHEKSSNYFFLGLWNAICASVDPALSYKFLCVVLHARLCKITPFLFCDFWIINLGGLIICVHSLLSTVLTRELFHIILLFYVLCMKVSKLRKLTPTYSTNAYTLRSIEITKQWSRTWLIQVFRSSNILIGFSNAKTPIDRVTV